MKIVVYGAAGWVGRAILESLSGKHEVRAFDRGAEAWSSGGEWTAGEILHGDVADYGAVDRAMDGMDAVIHAAVYSSPKAYGVDDVLPFTVNLKGLWNVLESARQRRLQRVVHVGSCHVVHPEGVFFSSEVRRSDGSLYAVTKRLQEEMCRQYHEAFGMSIVVLRPCSVIDSRLGTGKYGAKLNLAKWEVGWVCRHDLAEACRLGVEREGLGFEVLHTAGAAEADEHCNTQRSRQVLGLTYEGDPARLK